MTAQVVDDQYRSMVDFLTGLGTADIPHSGEKGFLAHLIGVYRDLLSWKCSNDVCRAGLFHSIYGTEMFRRFSLPLEQRDEVRALIGDRAELLAYVNCVMDRASFDALLDSDGPYTLKNRTDGTPIELPREDFDDLCLVHLCDWLEQVPRSQQWDYRRDAYRRMAQRLGGVALARYRQLYGE